MVSYGVYGCPLGRLVIGWEAGSIVSLKLTDNADRSHHPSPVSDLAAQQISEYLTGRRRDFVFPISLSGTTFQIAVWEKVRQIPYGQTRSYSQIASMIGNPSAARAIGQALNRNPLWIVIPCHRVIGKDRSITGYAGGMPLKQVLLELEQQNR